MAAESREAKKLLHDTAKKTHPLTVTTPKVLILAGGRSRRFGADKAFAMLQGKPLIAHVMAAFPGLPIAISAGADAARFADFRVPVLMDGEFQGQGPLAGLAVGLAWAADAGALITAPCDTPFLPADLVPRLLPAPAYARAGGRDHFLVASWPVAARATLLAILRDGSSLKVERFAHAIGARAVEFEDQGKDFLNINYRADLDNAALE